MMFYLYYALLSVDKLTKFKGIIYVGMESGKQNMMLEEVTTREYIGN